MLLIALAVVAENVSGRSWPMRFLTLFILRRAEAFAWDFVAGMTDFLPPILELEPESGNAPENALELAMRFRILAAILQELFRIECRLDRWNGSIANDINAPAGFSNAPASALSDLQPMLFDTS